MKKHIETEIEINASAEKIWKVLSDFDAYPQWNPFIKSITGAQSVGDTIVVTMIQGNGKHITFKPNILRFAPNEEFRWKGKLLFKGLFDGEHYFKIEPINPNKCRLLHGEHFSGILIGLLGKVLTETEKSFGVMNQKLKERCEA